MEKERSTPREELTQLRRVQENPQLTPALLACAVSIFVLFFSEDDQYTLRCFFFFFFSSQQSEQSAIEIIGTLYKRYLKTQRP